jgi:hypothetical protein
MKKIKFSKSKLNLWVETESGDLKLIKLPKKYARIFRRFFGTVTIPKESAVNAWIFELKFLS